MILIIYGVSGTGKSTVGKLLSEKLELPFFDGDDYHPRFNVEKMKSGFALDDKDRWPWLERLSTEIAIWESNNGAILACSALKKSYREKLVSKCKENINWVLLHGSSSLLNQRIKARKEHFFDAKLLSSQLATLEFPVDGWIVDVEQSPAEIVNEILAQLFGLKMNQRTHQFKQS